MLVIELGDEDIKDSKVYRVFVIGDFLEGKMKINYNYNKVYVVC